MGNYALSRFILPNAGVSVSEAGTDISTTAALGLAVENLDTHAANKDTANTFTAEQTFPDVKLTGLTGATAATRYVGGTASGSPGSGTFAVGDFVIDQTGKVWICTGAGTPGTWTQVGAASTPTMLSMFIFQNYSNATDFAGIGGGSATEANIQGPMAEAVTFTKMYVAVQTAPSSGQTFTYTLRKAGVDQSITCTISGTNTAANDTAHSVSFAAGDLISVKCVGSASAANPGGTSIMLGT